MDLSLPIFDKPRAWIREERDNGKVWSDIRLADRASEDELLKFLQIQSEFNRWPELNTDNWYQLVELQEKAEKEAKTLELLAGIAQIHDSGQDNATSIPQDPNSSWQLYRNKLLDDGFKKETVEEIERTTLKILKRLNINTMDSNPVKGLVIGNVQSGKTASMAALMAMAADWGWNMFIILSGTIENLRIQTQNRLFRDLNHQGSLFWRSLEHLSKSVDISLKTQSLHFDESSKERYFTVCLKVPSRLTKLIQWAQADVNKQRQMKILVIDDEADQAGINTANIDSGERRKINKLICSLVNGKDEKGEEAKSQYKAMNYVGYTATPYANILNESKPESLYPRSFISTLAVSKEYFGPQQIFGYSGDSVNYSGLDIVREISDEELDVLKGIHDGDNFSAPKSLVDAVCWFLCGVACMRIWGYKKPISMLVHTSQKTAHHKMVADVINNWLSKTSSQEIIDYALGVFRIEKDKFGLDKFRIQYPDYDIPDSQINNYPDESEIERELKVILNAGISHIELGADGDLTYNEGIHLCIDNCVNNGITLDGMHVRLAYPDPNNMPSPAPAFIVVGGATLSRGLTLEGLISTFFLRSVGQADTLMQMGRWFGYRKKYELLPRLWITKKTKAQFEFLSGLDQELRDEIQYMDINGRSPAEYGPKVKNSPKVSFIKITAKNRMQSATDSEMDYSGASMQTYLFDDVLSVQENNIKITEEFLASLGSPWIRNDNYEYHKGNTVWRGVDFTQIREYIERFSFQERLKVFNDTKPLLDWIERITTEGKLDKWNVVVAGKKTESNGKWILPDGTESYKVSRSRKKNDSEIDEKFINIGALRDPRDLLSDIDIDNIQNDAMKTEIIDYIKSGKSKLAMAFRDKSGLETVPQLLVYRIDKDSKYNGVSDREDLNACSDIIGLCLYIPGGRIGTSYASKISIKMKNDVFDGDADLEGTDEN